jgi:hypothetical protein
MKRDLLAIFGKQLSKQSFVASFFDEPSTFSGQKNASKNLDGQ